MLLSNSRRFIYIHPQGAAGESLEVALDATLRWDDILLGSTPVGEQLEVAYRRLHGLDKHSPARTVKKVVGDAVWRDYFTFSFVRNPFARMASIWFRSHELLQTALEREKISPAALDRIVRRGRYPERFPWNFPGVVACLENRGAGRPFPAFLRSPRLEGTDASATQWSSLSDPSNGEGLMDFVGRVESLAADWETIRERVGVPDLALGPENRAADDDAWRGMFDDADITLMRERFREDFHRFGYPDHPGR